MDSELLVLLVAPLVFGLGAIVGGILLLRKPAGASQRSTLRIVLAVLCFGAALAGLTLALAVGACVGMAQLLT